MKHYLYIAAAFFFLAITCINSCKKEVLPPPPLPSPSYAKSPVVNESFTENFDEDMDFLLRGRWVLKSQTDPVMNYNYDWAKGDGCDKANPCYPEVGGSYNGDALSFFRTGRGDSILADSWLFTPPVALANGDRIAFFTKASNGLRRNQLEVRINETDTTTAIGSSFGAVGKFTKELGKINVPYTTAWTRYEFTVSGLSTSIPSRIAFRYFVSDRDSASSIGIDAIQFIKK